MPSGSHALPIVIIIIVFVIVIVIVTVAATVNVIVIVIVIVTVIVIAPYAPLRRPGPRASGRSESAPLRRPGPRASGRSEHEPPRSHYHCSHSMSTAMHYQKVLGTRPHILGHKAISYAIHVQRVFTFLASRRDGAT